MFTLKKLGSAINAIWFGVTILSVGSMRAYQMTTCPEVLDSVKNNKGAGLGLSLGAGFFDFVSGIGTGCFGFVCGSIEGSLLSLTYPVTQKFFPKTYKYGKFGAHHLILPTYIFINSLYFRMSS